MDKKRIVWLDYARTFAIFCVILTHSTGRIYNISSGAPILELTFSNLVGLCFFTVGRLGVPVFFFLTGYLLLDRTFTYESTLKFYKTKFGGLLLTTEIWIIIYYLFGVVFYHSTFGLITLIENILFLKNPAASHLWYMPVILGIYLFIPFLSAALNHIDIRILYVPLLVAAIYLFGVPLCNVFLSAYLFPTLSLRLDLSFAGGTYGFCVLLGYLVKKNVFKRVPSVCLIFTGLFCFGFTVFSQYLSLKHEVQYYVWYNSATLLITSVCIFILFSRVDFKFCRWISSLAKYSFGIYLVHDGINLVLLRYINFQMPFVMKLAIAVALTLWSSWAFVYITAKEPHFKHCLFALK